MIASKPELVSNAKAVAVKANSQRLIYVATLLETLAYAWPTIEKHVELSVSADTFHLLSIAVLLGAAVARLVKQQNLS